MASRRFFYDPYDYYYSSPYHYPYPCYQYQHPAPSRGVGGFFPAAADAAPEAVKVDPRPRVESSRSVSIPVRFVGSDTEPVRGAARMPPAAAAVPRKRELSAEAAAVRLQAVARGFMARRSVRAVRDVEREAAEVAEKVARDAEALRGDARARIGVGEALMKLLLRLDAVRGAREYRRRVTKRVLALQDAVDALEPKAAPDSEAVAEENESEVTSEMADDSAAATELPVDAQHSGEIEVKAMSERTADMEVDGVLALQDVVDALETEPAPAPAPVPVGEEEAEVDAPEATSVEMAEESAAAQETPDAAERSSKMESIQTAVHTHTQMEVDEAIATGEPEAEEPEQGAGEEKEAVPGDANVDADEPEDSDAEGEWEMVTENEDTAPGAATSGDKEAPRKEPAACPLETMRTVSTGTASDGVDARKVMEMVAALCAVIGALAERVDALERTVRRMEDAESRRRRAKKLSTESK